MPYDMLYTASTWVLPVLIAITLHEAAHGFVAYRLGDDTAYRMGRVTFNPLKHIDLVGTILVPAILLLLRSPVLFGYAKPVPVNFGALRHPRRDMVLVALAGPTSNIAGRFAALRPSLLICRRGCAVVARNLRNALLINVVLAVFNMLPLPPSMAGGSRWLASQFLSAAAGRPALRHDDPHRRAAGLAGAGHLPRR
jgi:Zn-dependent protease